MKKVKMSKRFGISTKTRNSLVYSGTKKCNQNIAFSEILLFFEFLETIASTTKQKSSVLNLRTYQLKKQTSLCIFA